MDNLTRLLLIDSNQIEPNELFYPIKGYEKLYEISPSGKVFSLSTQRLMKPRVNKPHLYLYITLGTHSANNKRTIAIHRLVAEHFVPNLGNKEQVHHIDDDPLNNHFTNLLWVTSKEQIEFIRKGIKERGSLRNHKRLKN